MSAFDGWSLFDDTQDFNVVDYSSATQSIPAVKPEESSWWDSVKTNAWDFTKNIGSKATESAQSSVSKYVEDLFGGSRTSQPATPTGTPGLLPIGSGYSKLGLLAVVALIIYLVMKRK